MNPDVCQPAPRQLYDANGVANLTNLTVKGNTILQGPLTANGPATFNRAATFNGPLNINGPVRNGAINTLSPAVFTTLSIANPIFRFDGDLLLNKHMFNVTQRVLRDAVTITDLFGNVPLETIPNPPGISDVDVFRFTINNPPNVTPWYYDVTGDWGFEPAGTKVLFSGLPEIYSPGSEADRRLSLRNALSSMYVGFNIPSASATFNLNLRYSTEQDYDFISVIRNGVTLFRDSGYGPSAAQPYKAVTIPIFITTADTLEIRYVKDGAVYGGVDNFYFYLTNIEYVEVVPLPTALYVKNANGNIVTNWASFTILDILIVPRNRANVFREYQYEEGDYLELEPNFAAFSEFVVEYRGLL